MNDNIISTNIVVIENKYDNSTIVVNLLERPYVKNLYNKDDYKNYDNPVSGGLYEVIRMQDYKDVDKFLCNIKNDSDIYVYKTYRIPGKRYNYNEFENIDCGCVYQLTTNYVKYCDYDKNYSATDNFRFRINCEYVYIHYDETFAKYVNINKSNKNEFVNTDMLI